MRKIDAWDGRRQEGKRPLNVWRSYSDMMAGLLLVFVVVMAISFTQAQRSYEAELESQEVQKKLSVEVEAQKKEVEKQQEQLAEQQNRLAEQQDQLAEQQAELERQQKQLTEQQEALEEQKSLVKSQQQIMEEQQARIDKIIGIKAELIQELKGEFNKRNLGVSIDEVNGAITFDANVLFEYNSSVLTAEGKGMLGEMLPVYCQILLEDRYRDYLSEIMIDGFADTVGDYSYNLELSQARAYAVADFLLSIENDFLSPEQVALLESRLSANGRSKSNPVMTEDDQVDMAASRRVEVKFRLKDEEMIAELQKIMNNNEADAS